MQLDFYLILFNVSTYRMSSVVSLRNSAGLLIRIVAQQGCCQWIKTFSEEHEVKAKCCCELN